MCKFTTNILLCVTFILFTVKVSAQNADIHLLKTINSPDPAILRSYSVFISQTTTVISFSTPVVLGAVALLKKDDKMLKNSIYIGASIGVGGVMTYAMKRLISRPRPYDTYPTIIEPYTLEKSMSFPSGHTSLAFSTATALCFAYPKLYVIAPSYFWACSVGYSRLNLGVHYPTDVLAGALLGVGSSILTYKANEWFWKRKDNKRLIGLQAYL